VHFNHKVHWLARAIDERIQSSATQFIYLGTTKFNEKMAKGKMKLHNLLADFPFLCI
jgi:hypothetical protein